MKKITIFAVTLVLLGGLLGGCGSDAVDPITSGKAFLEAFPFQETLMASAPGLESQATGSDNRYGTVEQALVGDRAWLHDLSFLVAWQVNHQAVRIFGAIWFITRFPPTMAVLEDGTLGEGENQINYDARAVWGPYTDNEGKSLEYILHVWRAIDPDDGRRVFVWYAAGRPQGSDDEAWVVFLLGGAKPIANSSEGINRMGIVEVNLNALKQLDPTEDDVGYATYAFMEGVDFHAVAAVGEGVWTDKHHTKTGDVTYFYGHSAAGYFVFDFDIETNVEDLEGELAENLQVTTGWLANGHGRSDAAISGGDLGDQSASLTQCWGLDIKQTYFHLVAPEHDVEDGNVSSCISPDPVEVPDIDYEAIRDLFNFDF